MRSIPQPERTHGPHTEHKKNGRADDGTRLEHGPFHSDGLLIHTNSNKAQRRKYIVNIKGRKREREREGSNGAGVKKRTEWASASQPTSYYIGRSFVCILSLISDESTNRGER